MSRFHKGALVWLNKLPMTEDSTPNAKYIRELAELPGGVKACEVEYKSDRWQVGEHQLLSTDQARAKRATEWKAALDACGERADEKAKAAALGCSVSTMLKRQRYIQQWL